MICVCSERLAQCFHAVERLAFGAGLQQPMGLIHTPRANQY